MRAAQLARLHGSGLTLLHVVEYFPEDRERESHPAAEVVYAVLDRLAENHPDNESIVAGLRMGADDYVVKPFSGEQIDNFVRYLVERCGLRIHNRQQN